MALLKFDTLKGKPAERQGRKASGLSLLKVDRVAELLNERMDWKLVPLLGERAFYYSNYQYSLFIKQKREDNNLVPLIGVDSGNTTHILELKGMSGFPR